MKRLPVLLMVCIMPVMAQVTVTPNVGLQVPYYNQPNWQVVIQYDLNKLDLLLSGNLPIPNLLITNLAGVFMPIPGCTTLGTVYSPYSNTCVPNGSVSQLIAGTNITLSPSSGVGAVTISAASTSSTPFSSVTGSTNTTAAMYVGSGASLGTTGTGTIVATAAATLANTPVLCSPGYAPTGVLPNGNATGCQSVTGGGGGGATLPYPGLVWATSATGGTVASASQIVGAIGVTAVTNATNAANVPAGGVSGAIAAINGGTGEAGVVTGVAYHNGTSPDTAANATQIQAAAGVCLNCTTFQFGYVGTPASNQSLGYVVQAADTVTVPVNCNESKAFGSTASTTTDVFILQNCTSGETSCTNVGTVTFTSSATGVYSCVSSFTVSPGGSLTILGPLTATIVNPSFAVAGTHN